MALRSPRWAGLLADLRRAAKLCLPPSRYLLLDWCREWGETDCLLDRAVAYHDAMICPCGCGQWAPECHDPNMDGEYTVDTIICQAGAELARWRRDNQDSDPGTLVFVRRLNPGED